MPTKPRCNRIVTAPKQPSTPRKTSCKRGYDRRWQAFRLYFLRKNPCCLECEKEGQTIPANEVDHIHGHGGQEDPQFWNEQNLQSLCKRHHSAKTGRERERPSS